MANDSQSRRLPAGGPSVGNGIAQPSLRVTLNPPKNVFFISADARMPSISAAAEIVGAAVPAEGVNYTWNVALALNPVGVPHAVGRTTSHPAIHDITNVPTYTIPFTAVRGGILHVSVSATVNGQLLKGEKKAEIKGTNPSSEQLRAYGVPELLLKLMTAESSLRQFLTTGHKAGYPLFSSDNLGGVGLGQITRPRPTNDEVWNWKSNVTASVALYHGKQRSARTYLTGYPHSREFRALVQAYNASRIAGAAGVAGARQLPGQAAPVPNAAGQANVQVQVTLPAYTEEMLENETIRLYNGEPVHLHEYIALEQNGVLVVTLAPNGTSGTAQWHEVTVEERRAYYQAHNLLENRWGDPNYVEHVRNEVVP